MEGETVFEDGGTTRCREGKSFFHLIGHKNQHKRKKTLFRSFVVWILLSELSSWGPCGENAGLIHFCGRVAGSKPHTLFAPFLPKRTQ